MFDSVADETLRAAHDAARLLYDNHRALGAGSWPLSRPPRSWWRSR